MTDVEKPDYATLRWVKEGIDETILHARQALERYGESGYTSDDIEQFAAHVHQLSGTLRMVQVYGGGMLAEEMERIAGMLVRAEIPGNASVAESLMLGLVQLPQYLNRLEKGEPDIPLALLPVLNDLRSYREVGPASEATLYAPNLNRLIEREPIIPGSGNPSISEIVHRLRMRYHKALLLTYRNENVDEGLQQILEIVQEINAVAGTLRLRRLMDAAEALILTLREGEFSADAEVKPLFSRLDRVFRDLIDKGEEATVRDFPMELLKSLLYFVSRSHSHSSVVETVKRTADLANSFPDQIHKASSEVVIGADDSIQSAVTRVLLDDLAAVKESLDLYIRGDHEDVQRLQGLDAQLNKIADTLGMLGRGYLREQLLKVADLLADAASGSLLLDQDQLMDVATAVVAVESALSVANQQTMATAQSEAEDIQERQVDSDVLDVIQQASTEYSNIKDVVEKYLRGQLSQGRLASAVDDLGRLAGVFEVSNLQEPSSVLSEVAVVLKKVVDGKKTLSPVHQGALVDVLAGVEYYLEAKQEGRQNIQQFITYAEEALEHLVADKESPDKEIYPEVEEIHGALSADEELSESDTNELIDDDSQLAIEEDSQLSEDSVELELDELPTEEASDTIEDLTALPDESPEEEIVGGQVEEAVSDEADDSVIEEDEQEPAPQPITAMDEIDPEIFDIFMEEAGDELTVIQTQYPLWRANTENEEPLQTFRRSFHTLKGSGRMVGAHIIGEFAWAVENLLNRVIEGSVPISRQLIEYMDKVTEAVPLLIEAQANGTVPDVDVHGLEKTGFQLAENKVPVDEIEAVEPESVESESVESETVESEIVETVEEALEESAPDTVEQPVSLDKASTPSSLLLADDLSEIFKAESMTHLEVVQQFIDKCTDCEVDDVVVRAIHTLHGSAHLAEVAPMAALAGAMEGFCKHLNRLSFTCDESIIEIFKAFHDKTQEMVDAINVPDVEVSGWQELIQAINAKDQELPEVISELQPGQDSELLGVTESDQEMAAIFLEEAGEVLEHMAESVMEWETNGSHVAAEAIRSGMHQIKGSARLAGLGALGEVAYGLESFFDALIQSDGDVDPDTRQKVVHIVDEIENALDNLHLNGKLPDLIGLTQEANILAQGMQRLLVDHEEEEHVEPEHYEEPESILFSETWKAEHEAHEHPQFERPEQKESPDQGKVAIDVDPELLEIFLDEAGEIGEQLEEHLLAWQDDIQSKEAVDGLMRNLHTLKGNARFAGLFSLGDLSHALESLFEGLATDEIKPDPNLVPLVRMGMDGLESAIDQLQRESSLPELAAVTRSLEAAASGADWQLPVEEVQEAETESLAASTLQHSSILETEESQLHQDTQDSSFIVDSQLLTDSELFADSEIKESGGNVVPFPIEGATPRPHKRPPPLQAEAEQTGKGERVRVLAELLDQLVNNAGEVSIYRARLEQQNKVVQGNLEELNDTIVRLRTQLRALELETEAHVLSGYEREAHEKQYEDFDPLEMDRYSKLQQLSRALSETISDLSNIGETLGEQTRDADTLLLQQERVTTDLQDGLLRSRMVPFKRQASRLQRVVRQTAQNLSKKAELDVVGADGEIDRTILNRIMGPLEHLLRNAVAHGIEPPDLRAKMEKPKMGKVTLTLAREGTEVVLTIADDGAGLDSEAIRRKAVASGLLEENAVITEDALYQFILQPGFTTAAEVTQVAGRGVGMDAVVSEIKQLGGSLEILSQRERGSSFVIRLPFTLAISEALLVTVGEEVFAIPHGSAEVIIRAKREDLQACYNGQSEGIEYNGHQYRVRYLGALLGIAEPTLSDSVKWYPLLLVRSGEQRMAIQMDNLLGNYQIVVKSIGTLLSGVNWFTGGTILADGSIALLLDMNALVRSDGVMQMPIAAEEEETAGISVMVVDDSVTVRKVTSRLLERHNMNVLTARDGVDAITVLQDHKPDVMLLDIEMPRMDGYELARHIRNTPELADIPIIMITSRSGEKHRQRAFDLGVNRYLGKPYQEVDLLENIYALLGDENE